MRTILFALILALAATTANAQTSCGAQSARSCQNVQTINTSGGAITIQNNAGLVPTFEYTWTGSPSAITVTLSGCGLAGTCETLDTYTSSTNSLRAPTISKVYASYQITAAWTGTATLTVSTIITSAQGLGGGGGGGAVNAVFGRTGDVTAANGDYSVSQVTGAAPLASPALTGTPTAPTATVGTNTTQLATTAFVLANAGSGTTSTTEIPIQQACPGAVPVDPNTGLTLAGGAGTNVKTCVNTALATATPTQKVIVKYDGTYVGAPIMGPASGNWGIDGTGAGVARIKITAWSCTGTTCTFTILPVSGVQQLVANQTVQIGGTGTSLDGGSTGGGWRQVLSTGLSATHFEASSSFSGSGTSTTAEADFLYGAGVYVPNGTNDDGIRAGGSTSVGGCTSGNEDAGWIAPGEAPSLGANVSITNILVNGNRYQPSGTAGNSTSNAWGIGNFPATLYSTSSPYCFYKNINIQNTQNVLIQNVVSYNSPAFNIKFDNAAYTLVDNVSIYEVFPNQTATPMYYGDGIHYSGNNSYGYIENTTINASDDAVAYNAPEGTVGPINHMHIAHSNFGGFSVDGVRAYTGSIAPPSGDATPLVGTDMDANDYDGTGIDGVGFFGLFSGTRTFTVANSLNYTWANSHVTGPMLMLMDDTFGSLTFTNIQSDGSTCTNGNGFLNIYQNAVTGGAINLTGIRINRTSAGHCTVAALDTVDTAYGGSSAGALTLHTMNILNLAVNDVDGGSYGAMPQMLKLGSGTVIANYKEAGTDSKNITARNTGAGTITAVSDDTFGGATYNCASATFGTSVLCPATPQLLVAAPLYPQIMMENDGAATDAKYWDTLGANAGILEFRAINDANTAANTWLTVSRSGYIPQLAQLGVPVGLKTYTVGTLPAAGVGAGSTVVVTDATTFTPGTCTGGGSDYMIAVSNGSTWSCH